MEPPVSLPTLAAQRLAAVPAFSELEPPGSRTAWPSLPSRRVAARPQGLNSKPTTALYAVMRVGRARDPVGQFDEEWS